MVRILVIDDEAQVRSMLQGVLDEEGYQVVVAADGREGLELYRQKPCELVITDLLMPEKEGLETIRELRHDFPGVKIIAISGGSRVNQGLIGADLLKLAKNFGALRVMQKPVELQTLLDTVQEMLGSHEPHV